MPLTMQYQKDEKAVLREASIALIAHRAQVPMQTILIETDSAYLSKGWPLFRKPPMPIHYRGAPGAAL